MNVLRITLAGCLVAVLAGCTSSTTKPPATTPAGTTPTHRTEPVAASNKEKIVGTWELTKGEGETPRGATFEFTKEGKLTMSAKVEGKEHKMEGTYTVENGKLTTARKGPGGKEEKETMTITELTDKKLVTKDDKGKSAEFQKK
jgi:uncharacterized protein (TIGR03066 family)